MNHVWRCGRFEMPLDETLVMGILNITPDSFSDGGQHADPDIAVAAGLLMVANGAAILDVGGESTRPGAPELSTAEEEARVLPVVSELAAGAPFPVSIDTRHAEVARSALDAGASIVNDVGGFRDSGMVDVAASTDAGVVVMHMLGEPGTMQDDPRYDDVVTEVRDFLLDRALGLEDAGVARERICIDPGIGFGKTLEHNLLLLGALPELSSYGYPVLVGASRKRFIGMLGGAEEPKDRIGGSIAAAVWAAFNGASVVRVHDVRETVEALRVASAIRDSIGR